VAERLPAQITTLHRGRLQKLSGEALRERASCASRVLVDLGTGDALFPYRQARADPSALCIGVDPAADNMRKTSARIGRKPARGGVENLLLVVARAEALPEALRGLATRLTVLFPWSGLLRALVQPDPAVLATMRSLLLPTGRLDSLINLQVFEDAAYRARQDLPELDLAYVQQVLQPRYSRAGLPIETCQELGPGPLPMRTSWGQHLALGSKRRTLQLVARAAEPAATAPDPSEAPDG